MQLLAVNYHYIRDKKPEAGIYPLSLSELDAQVEALSQYYQFTNQSEILSWIENNNFPKGNYCLLTFDDGLKEQMEAFYHLKKKGITPLLYVLSDMIEFKTVADVHKLHYIRSVISDQELYRKLDEQLSISKVNFDENLLADQYRYDHVQSRKIKYFLNFILKPEEKKHFIHDLFLSLVSSESDFSNKFYMDQDDLIELAQSNALGTHGAAHLPLATLSGDAMRDDLSRSIKFLENQTNSIIKTISYPYGGKSAVSPEVAQLSKELDLKFGFTMLRDLNTVENFKMPLLLNRIDTNDAPGGKSPSDRFILSL